MNTNGKEATLGIGSRHKRWVSALIWAAIAAGAAVFQLYIPKARIEIPGDKASVLSFNSALRGLFLVSPWVGIICSAGGQLNVLPRILINPAHLITPAVYALLGILFNKLSRRWGRSIPKDFILLTGFGLIQSTLAILNGALTNSIGLGQALMVSVDLAGITLPYLLAGASINTLIFYLSYPVTKLIDKYCKGDPFTLNLREKR
jgi:hypothetical protein